MRLENNQGETRHVTEDGIWGRSHECDWMIPHETISAQHAKVSFRNGAWHLRDLGSRNGTWLDGERIASGTWRKLKEGQRIELGKRGDSWLIIDTSAPFMAISSDGRVICAVNAVIAIPDSDAPQLLVLETSDGYCVERDEERRSLSDGEAIEVGEVSWTVRMPPPSSTDTVPVVSQVFLRDCTAIFTISADQEHVKLELQAGSLQISFPARSHLYCLSLLARRYVEDKALNVPPGECGWCTRDEITSAMKVTVEKLNLDLYRARRALASKGVRGVEMLAERRLEAGLMRLGFADVIYRSTVDSEK